MENNKTTHESIRDSILQKINMKEVTMRPKLYFTLKAVAIIATAIVVLLLSVFIINFILFSIRINSRDILLGFGPRGWGAFLHFFPWPMLILDIALVVLLKRLVSNFKFGYKTPALYMLAGLIIPIFLLAVIIDRGTDVNDRLLRQAEAHHGQSPFFDIYAGAREHFPPGSGLCLCTVQSITGSTLLVKDTRSTTTLTLILNQNEPNATTTGLQIGDTVFVAGEVEDGVVKTFGIRKVPPESLRFR